MYLAEVGDLYMHPSTQPSAQVRGAGQYIPQVLVPHELPASLMDKLFNL